MSFQPDFPVLMETSLNEPRGDKPHEDLAGTSVSEGQEHGNEPQDSGRAPVEKAQLSLEPSTTQRQEGKAGGDSSHTGPGKRKRKMSPAGTDVMGFSSIINNNEEEEEFEAPSRSFEEYLTYDEPQKKKKKKKIMANPPMSPWEEEQCPTICLLCNTSLDGPITIALSPRRKRTNEERAEQETSDAPQLKRILLDLDLTLPDIPLPPIQASCGPLPAPESLSCSQNITRAASSPDQPSQVGCTDHQPKPRSPVLPEGSQHLWAHLWLRDFQSEEPEEFQSWQEMYLYHQQAREREQVAAAPTIASAPAHHGQANDTVPPHSLPGAPQEGHPREEELGTGGAPLPHNTNISPVPSTPSQGPTFTPRHSSEAREKQPNNRPRITQLWSALAPRARFSWFPILRKPSVKSFKRRTTRRFIQDEDPPSLLPPGM